MTAFSNREFRDRLYSLLLGSGVAALAWAWQFDDVPPDLVDDLAAAAGLRPPTGAVSLLWHFVMALPCRLLGLPIAEAVLRVAGHLSLGFAAVLVARVMETLLPVQFRRGEHVAAWWRVAVRAVLYLGVALFCLSDPMWSAFRWFSPTALQVLLALSAAALYVAHFRTVRRKPLFASFALLGLLVADTPVGTLLLVAAAVGILSRDRLRAAGVVVETGENPLFYVLMSWRITLSFAAGAVVGAVLEACSFILMDGFAAFGWDRGDYICTLPLVYLKTLLATCSPAGLVVVLAVVVLPAIVAVRLVGRAMDDEKHLSYFSGMVYLVCAIVSLAALSGVRSLWFWTWAGECVRDGLVKCVAVFVSALVFVWSMAVFTFELWLRNFRRVEALRSPDAAESTGAAGAFALVRRLQSVSRLLFIAVPFLALACSVPFREQRMEREMASVVADAAAETAAECRGVDFLFTDGGLDAAVELAAAEAGGRLRALSLMGSADDARDVYLRTRGVADPEDLALLTSGAPDALRTWVRERPEKAGTYAVQIGFELWRRLKQPLPECSGLVARPGGFAPGEAKRGAEAARALARRVLSLYEEGNPGAVSCRALRSAFVFAQWRLAVIARHRANAYDARGDRKLAVRESELADALDHKNAALSRIRATMSWASRKRLERLTPQEGLRVGLKRADFALARTFALRVLDFAPDDPEANFAVGMDYFVQRQYARAQSYLERCLEHRPDDPAVLNNLAQCRLGQGDAAGALGYAERALQFLPDSPEVKRTIERVREAIASSSQ